MSFYECTYVTRPDLTQSDINKYIEKFSGIIATGGGRIVKTEQWGLRTLAYRIKKHKKGHYVHLGVEAPHQAVLELERNFKITEDVIRHLSVKVDAISEEPSAIMRQASMNEAFLTTEEV